MRATTKLQAWTSSHEDKTRCQTPCKEQKINKNEDKEEYKKFLRMSPENFDEISRLVTPDIQKKNASFREEIPEKVKLTATIRFLSTGDSYDLQHLFRVHKSTYRSLFQLFAKPCIRT